eukprot:m.336196 g.336196  ORF g.336196 m.336196 type:complete len:158 (+) comp17779_c0_seq1:280-753(+)
MAQPVSFGFMYNIKLFMAIHLILALAASFSHMYAYNLVTVVILVWSIYKYEDNEPMFVCLCVFVMSIMMDIIVLCIYAGPITATQPYSIYRDTNRFCLGMTILALMIKPWTFYLMLREFTRRGGVLGTYIPGLRKQGGYTSLDNETEKTSDDGDSNA